MHCTTVVTSNKLALISSIKNSVSFCHVYSTSSFAGLMKRIPQSCSMHMQKIIKWYTDTIPWVDVMRWWERRYQRRVKWGRTLYTTYTPHYTPFTPNYTPITPNYTPFTPHYTPLHPITSNHTPNITPIPPTHQQGDVFLVVPRGYDYSRRAQKWVYWYTRPQTM